VTGSPITVYGAAGNQELSTIDIAGSPTQGAGFISTSGATETAAFVFGTPATPVEADIYSTTSTLTFNNTITADGLTKFGAGAMTIATPNDGTTAFGSSVYGLGNDLFYYGNITGLVTLNTGAITLNTSQGLGVGSGSANTIVLTGNGATLQLGDQLGVSAHGILNASTFIVASGILGAPQNLANGVAPLAGYTPNSQGLTVYADPTTGAFPTGYYPTNIVVHGDSSINNAYSQTYTQSIGSLIIPALTTGTNAAGSLDGSGAATGTGVTLGIYGIQVLGTTQLGGDTILNVSLGTSNRTNLEGPIMGIGGTVASPVDTSASLSKFGTGILMLNNSTNGNTFSGPIIINGGVVGTTVTSGSPFGTGPITVDPGGSLRISDPSNIASNVTDSGKISVITEPTGIGFIGMSYNPASSAAVQSLLGNVNFSTTVLASDAQGAVSGGLGIDTSYFTAPLNMASLGDGNLFLGSTSTSGTAFYAAPSLAPGAGNVYRIGGGGGALALSPLYANVLTGTASVQVGVASNGANAAGVVPTNGNGTDVI
ncbi:MAG TPA: hypothetical protein VIK18_10940, partial [Pirellulales bacterium]